MRGSRSVHRGSAIQVYADISAVLCSRPHDYLFVYSMQALGAPITLWNPQTDGDTFTASVLEGFSIPPALSIVIRPQSSPLQDFSPYRLQSAPLIDSLFRPPAIS